MFDCAHLIYDNYGFETQILAASVRHTMHVEYAAVANPPRLAEEAAAGKSKGKGKGAASAAPREFRWMAEDQMKEVGVTAGVLKVIAAVEDRQIDEVLGALSPDACDVLMKYIYKGLESPEQSSQLLKWHAKLREMNAK